MKRYSEEHEWLEVEGDIVTIGITSHAASELGDITFVELPEINAEMAQGDVLSVVESVKAASDVYSPISGNISEVNTELNEHPEIMNKSPESTGWICKMKDIKQDELSALMTEEEYSDFIAQ